MQHCIRDARITFYAIIGSLLGKSYSNITEALIRMHALEWDALVVGSTVLVPVPSRPVQIQPATKVRVHDDDVNVPITAVDSEDVSTHGVGVLEVAQCRHVTQGHGVLHGVGTGGGQFAGPCLIGAVEGGQDIALLRIARIWRNINDTAHHRLVAGLESVCLRYCTTLHPAGAAIEGGPREVGAAASRSAPTAA